MGDGSHLAIGEVLKLLSFDFPDVTISKIRFLESQGLINPERTASGYRKFYEDDIRRLQWVLRQQKERFLPLKVIKEKLDAGEDRDDAVQPTLFGDAEPPPAPVGRPRRPGEASAGDSSAIVATEVTSLDGAAPMSGTASTVAGPPAAKRTPEGDAARHPAAAGVSPRPEVSQRASDDGGLADPAAADTSGPAEKPEATSGSAALDPAAWLAALQEGPRRPSASRPVEPVFSMSSESSGDTYSREEAATAASVTIEVIGALEEFGLLRGRVIAGEARFDDAAIEVARAAGVFIGKGIEARHLRAYKLAAEREVTLFEQLTLPLLRQRNPSSRQMAIEELSGLVRSGAALRDALLRQALGPHVRPR